MDSYNDLLELAHGPFVGNHRFLANLIKERKHFKNCWWPPTKDLDVEEDGNGRWMLYRGSQCEPFFKNLSIGKIIYA